VLAASSLGSCFIFVSSAVVMIALAAIGRDMRLLPLDLQWTTNVELLPLAALTLVAGGRLGWKRIFLSVIALNDLGAAAVGFAPSFARPHRRPLTARLGRSLDPTLRRFRARAGLFPRQESPCDRELLRGVAILLLQLGMGLAITPSTTVVLTSVESDRAGTGAGSLFAFALLGERPAARRSSAVLRNLHCDGSHGAASPRSRAFSPRSRRLLSSGSPSISSRETTRSASAISRPPRPVKTMKKEDQP
jgi:MFS family permease